MQPCVSHARIVPGSLEDRSYQKHIAEHATRENVLVVLPTGLGKTAIALRVAAHFLEVAEDRSVLFLAPTRPLVEQHAMTVARTLKVAPPVVLTGMIGPQKRSLRLSPPQVVVATPQVIANDLASGILGMSPFSLVIFDEVHRARGSYPYVTIARAFHEVTGGRMLGMTASPGSNTSSVREVMDCIWVSASGLEVRDGTEPDVSPYLHGINVEPVYIDSPEDLHRAGQLFRKALDRHTKALVDLGVISSTEYANRRTLLEAGKRLHAALERQRASGERQPQGLWPTITRQAVAMKIAHAIELVETQGVESLGKYMDRMRAGEKSRSPSTRMFLADEDVKAAMSTIVMTNSEHPKLRKAVQLVRDELKWHEGSRVILFAHYRDTAEKLVEMLKELQDPNVRPTKFVGQSDRGETDVGLTQKQQAACLTAFREGNVNCLVATSVAEEGLDIPATDLVIFYEPVPSEIRTIQRRGRTGRARTGRVVVLLTRATQDVATHFSARGKEWKMKKLIEGLKGPGAPGRRRMEERQTQLDLYAKPA